MSVLELIEESASGGGTFQFLPEDRAPRPIAELWDASARASGWVQDHAGIDGTVAVVASTSFAFAGALIGALLIVLGRQVRVWRSAARSPS